MEKKFVIECRYEKWTNTGKEFSKWFIHESEPLTEDNAKKIIKEDKERFGYIDQKTKLKHEYRLKSYDEYLKELEDIKEHNAGLEENQKKYFASKEYKELCKKKRQSAKERKEKQKKYLEEHQNDDKSN